MSRPQTKKKEIIIFSGFNSRAILAFLRTLTTNQIHFSIIAVSPEDSIFQTSYCSNVYAIRKSFPLDLDDILNVLKTVQEKRKADEYVIVPSTEALNRFILEHRDILAEINCTFPMVDKNLYERISDKFSFGQLCQEHSILTPKEFVNINDKKLPLVAKPISYFSSQTEEILSPVLLYSPSDLREFLSKYQTEDFYYQELVSGKSLYLLYYFHRDGTVYKFSQENLVQQPGGKSIVAAISSNFHHSKESAKYEQLFESVNYFGLVMVEVKQDGNQIYMIEANPRFWGPSQLFVDAEMNFFNAFLHDWGFLAHPPIFNEKSDEISDYFWYGGIMETILDQKNVVYHNYTPEQMIEQFPRWISSDIYRRKDSLGIFRKETKI